MGRFGNQLFQYCFARGYAESLGFEFECAPWVGQKIFTLNDSPLVDDMPHASEDAIHNRESNITFFCYAQQQRCVDFYSKDKLSKWLVLQPQYDDVYSGMQKPNIACHLRRGDYIGAGYPVVSRNAYVMAMEEHGLKLEDAVFVSDDFPVTDGRVDPDVSFIVDWFRLAGASHLFRANSSFSWWASAWGHPITYSPVIDGLTGGMEHDNVRFVKGNHPKLADLGFITELQLQ